VIQRTTLAFLAAAATAVPVAARPNLRQPSAGLDADFDGKSFRVGGRRVLLLSGAVHYYRVPPEEWRERLLQTRLAGFNMVETPVPWNLHQPAKETFRFDGAADLARFLDLCHETKLLALVRIGPYVNAAVTNGGLPAWLGDDPRLLVRSSSARFIDAVSNYWEKLLPVVAARQVPRGPVAMVQIEDHYRGEDRSYLPRLYEKAVNHGVRVPTVLSELNACTSFGRFRVPDDAFFATTEFLPAGPLRWGEPYRAFRDLDAVVLEGLARGIDGYNHSMWAAGTNIILPPASSFPTRFEASTCGVLEDGGISPVFADVKKVNLFARTFERVLTEATTVGTHPLLEQARGAGLVAYGRSDGKTSLLFFKRRYGKAHFSLRDEVTGQSPRLLLDDVRLRHVVVNFPVTPRTTLALATAQVLTVQTVAGRRMFVVYVPKGSEALMVFRTAREPVVRVGATGLTWEKAKKQLLLKWRCAEKGARADFIFEADAPVHVVALEEKLVARAWVLGDAGILLGAPGIGEWTSEARVAVELRFPSRRGTYALSFYPNGAQQSVGKVRAMSDIAYDQKAGRIDFKLQFDTTRPTPVLLRRWEMADAAGPAAPDFNDAGWADTLRPEPLGESNYGWYRCRFRSSRAVRRTLRFENVADAVTVYLNGHYVGQSATKRLMDGPRGFAHPASFELSVEAGENVLAVLAKNWGRYRNTASYRVPLRKTTAWGIVGNALLDGRPAGRWRRREGMSPKTAPLAWGPAKEHKSPVRWYRAVFQRRRHPARVVPRVFLRGLGHGAIWLNGRYLGLYQQKGYDAGHGYHVPPTWLRQENELIVLEESGRQPEEAEVRFDPRASVVPVRVEFR